MTGARSATKPKRSRSTAPRGLGEALEFMRVLWELDHLLRRASKSMEARLGVTGPQRLVIRLVGRFPDVTAGDLAALMHIDPSSLTGILDRLERAGFLVRRSDRADRRRALFSLTAKGRALDQIRGGTVEAAVVRALKTQSAGRIQQARSLLTALASELNRSSESIE